MDFICLEENLFSFGLENTLSIARSFQDEEKMDTLLEVSSNSLLSVISTLELNNPSILIASNPTPTQNYQSGDSTTTSATISKLVGILKQKLRDLYSQGKRKIRKEPGSDIVIIFDRNEDLITPLRHKWTYGSLIHDSFKVHLNRISGVVSEGKEKQALISWKDTIWREISFLSFPDACSKLEEELNSYQMTYSQIEENQGVTEIEPLRKALEDLPSLREKKRWIDTHLVLASSLLAIVQEKRHDLLRELEGVLIKKGPNIDPTSNFMQFFSSDKQEEKILGNEQDRIRVFLIAFLASGKNMKLVPLFQEKLKLQDSTSIIMKMISFFSSSSPPELASSNIHSNKYSLEKLATPSLTNLGESTENYTSSMMMMVDSISGTTTTSTTTMLAKMVMQGIKRISGTPTSDYLGIDDNDNSIPLIRYVENILLGNTERIPVVGNSNTSTINPTKLVIFVFGGISYDEYQALSSYLSFNWPGIDVTIGSTSLLSSSELLTQLEYS